MVTSSIHGVQVATPLMLWKIEPKARSKIWLNHLRGWWWWVGGSEGGGLEHPPNPLPTGADLLSGTLGGGQNLVLSYTPWASLIGKLDAILRVMRSLYGNLILDPVSCQFLLVHLPFWNPPPPLGPSTVH